MSRNLELDKLDNTIAVFKSEGGDSNSYIALFDNSGGFIYDTFQENIRATWKGQERCLSITYYPDQEERKFRKWFMSSITSDLKIYRYEYIVMPSLQAFCGREILKTHWEQPRPSHIHPHTWNISKSNYQATVEKTTHNGVDSWFGRSLNK